MAKRYREGEGDIRNALRKALAGGRTSEDFGPNFVYDDERNLVGSDLMVDGFLLYLAVAIRDALLKGGIVDLAGFGTFYVDVSPARVGSGALAGRLLKRRKRIAFRPSPSGWDFGPPENA